MRRNHRFWIGAATALVLFVVPTGMAFAGDSNTLASGFIDAMDANQGSGTQVNGDDWKEMFNALVGSGNQSADIYGPANTGSGEQDNSFVDGADWKEIVNANAGPGSQVLQGTNSNGGDRVSNDVVIDLGSNSAVANAALEAQVTGNAVVASGANAQANSSITMSGNSGFTNMYGVNAIAVSSGANSSQNVSVNVTARVNAGGGGY